MFQTTQRSEQNKKGTDAKADSKSSKGINVADMMKGHESVTSLGQQPAQRMVAEEREEEKPRQAKAIQKKSEPSFAKASEDKGNGAKSSSGTKSGLSGNLKTKMEGSFGADFSDVNIHKDSDNATNLGALAYTQGNDVHFAPGQFNSESTSGQELIGHELAHVVQQRQGRVKTTKEMGKGMSINDSPALESEADEMGKLAVQGKSAQVKGTGSGVQREEDKVMEVNLISSTPSDLSYEELLNDSLNTRKAILFNHLIALQNFETIVNSSSKKDTAAKGVGEIALDATAKFVLNLVLDEALGKIPGAKQLFDLSKSIFEEIEKEQKRAKSASVSYNLGQFIVKHRTSLAKLHSNIEASQVNIVNEAMGEYNASNESLKTIIKRIESHTNARLTGCLNSSHAPEGLFAKISTDWINFSNDSETGSKAYVFVNMDTQWKVKSAHIHAPKGQKLAEQLLLDGGGKVDLNSFGSKRVVGYLSKIFLDINSNGSGSKLRHNPFFTKPEEVEFFKEKITTIGIPETTILTGDE